jgi:hypothetical protein
MRWIVTQLLAYNNVVNYNCKKVLQYRVQILKISLKVVFPTKSNILGQRCKEAIIVNSSAGLIIGRLQPSHQILN